MQLRGTCAALASALSAKYATYQEFSSSHDSLPQYLDRNGVVVSMCTGGHPVFSRHFQCSLNHHDRILSASWLQENQTNFRVFQLSQLQVDVGMVLDPTAGMEPQCLFPADAATVSRDDLHEDEQKVAKGCGPIKNDPRFGSKGYDNLPRWQQLMRRAGWNAYSWKQYHGNHSVSCADFFFQESDDDHDHILDLVPQLYIQENTNVTTSECFDNWIIQDYLQYYTESVEYEVGHKLCTDNDPVPRFNEANWLIYTGPCSYQPNEFNEMINKMQEIDELHPRVQNWNEIVFDRPKKQLEDVVQAVFYLESALPGGKTRGYRNALRQAKRLGKHLFSVHPSGQPLFTCNVSAEELVALA